LATEAHSVTNMPILEGVPCFGSARFTCVSIDDISSSGQGAVHWDHVKWTLADQTYKLLSRPGQGSLASAWTSASFNQYGNNNDTATAALLGTSQGLASYIN
jgi:hypothetical protein